MRIEPRADGGFSVFAENATDRAVLTRFTSTKESHGRALALGGHTYECDYSAVTQFNFNWVDGDWYKPRPWWRHWWK